VKWGGVEFLLASQHAIAGVCGGGGGGEGGGGGGGVFCGLLLCPL